MKQIIIILSFVFLFSGCNSFEKKVDEYKSVSFSSVEQPVSNAQEKILRAWENSKAVESHGTSAKSPISQALVKDTSGAYYDLKTAKEEIPKLQSQVDALTVKVNMTVKDYNNLLTDYDNIKAKASFANKAIWIRNFIILGLGLWAVKGPLIWIARKFAGLP